MPNTYYVLIVTGSHWVKMSVALGLICRHYPNIRLDYSWTARVLFLNAVLAVLCEGAEGTTIVIRLSHSREPGLCDGTLMGSVVTSPTEDLAAD